MNQADRPERGQRCHRLARRAGAALLASLLVTITLHASQRPQVMAHYMPWYSTKEVSGHWGWHWTMNKFDPEKKLPDGRREAASHDYPLIGLYDSGDPHALECQVQLMKLAGIDGVIVDWYGIRKHNDYAPVHANTQKLISVIKRAGLKFAICYEDQSIKHMVAGGALKKEDALSHGREVMRWMNENWFRDEAYLKVDGAPLLLVFGPQYFEEPAQWRELFSGLSLQPRLHVLPHLMKKAGTDRKYGWPPVHGGKEVKPRDWRASLDRLYSGGSVADSVVGVAFPGFRDIYAEAGLHDSYGHIAENNGATFRETFDRAMASGTKVVQIATWNDYGEGTVIEPTRRNEFRFLEDVQRRLRPVATDGSRFEAATLRLPVELYRLRKRLADEDSRTGTLDGIAAMLFEGHVAPAASALKRLQAKVR